MSENRTLFTLVQNLKIAADAFGPDHGRPVMLIDIDDVRVPFYVSTGKGGKKNVPVGQWYPFFGMGHGDFKDPYSG